MQIEQVFERPSGCRLFQLFGDVMPETLFTVRSDSETYGMQRSVKRQGKYFVSGLPAYPLHFYCGTFAADRTGMPQPAFRFPPFDCNVRSGQGNMLFHIRR